MDINITQVKTKPSKGIIKAHGHVVLGPFGAYWKRTRVQIVFL